MLMVAAAFGKPVGKMAVALIAFGTVIVSQLPVVFQSPPPVTFHVS